jgi:predicted Zn-dependent protease with MMP-like domain
LLVTNEAPAAQRPLSALVDDDAFEDLVDEATGRIPEPFRSVALRTVAIVVEEEPSASQRALAGARQLFGLYQGVPRTAWGADSATVASKITIFRGPLRRAHPTAARLAAAVDDVVRHEIAHHLGIGDRRLSELRRPAIRQTPTE